MGFKLASLFVTVEAQTAKFAEQMGKVKKTAASAGSAIADTDFEAVGDQLLAVFEALPAKLAAAMAPVAAKLQRVIPKSFNPFDRMQSSLEKISGQIVHAFRFDLIEKGIELAKSGLDVLFASATGKAAMLGSGLQAALSFGNAINSFNRFKAQLASAISPSKNLARVILFGVSGAMAGASSAVGAFTAQATGRARVLGVAIQKALDTSRIAVKSKLVVDYLATMIRRAVNLRGAINGVVSGLGRAVTAAANLTSRLTGAHKAAQGVRGVLGEIVVAAGFAAVGFQIATFFQGAVMGASHLGETIDKVDAVLGEGSRAVKDYANVMADKFGLVKQTTLDAASGFAGLAKGLGQLKGKELSDFSIKMTQLSADFASFADIDFDTSQKAIKIGLTGEPSDVLKQFGVIVNETTTKQYALQHGMQLVNGKLTEQQKLMARAGLITQQLADADQNLAITQGSTQNRLRLLSGLFENLQIAIGQALLPIVNKAIGMFIDLGKWIAGSFQSSLPAIEGFVQKAVIGLNIVEAAIKHWPQTFQIVQLYVGQTAENISIRFNTMAGNLAKIWEWISKAAVTSLGDIQAYLKKLLPNLIVNAAAFAKQLAWTMANPFASLQDFKWTPMADSFKSTVDKFPDLLKPKLIDMSKDINDLLGEIGKDVDWNPDVKVQGTGAKKGVAVDHPDVQEEKGQGKISDLQAFAQSLQEAVGGKGKAEEQTAKNTKDLLDEMKKLNAGMGDFRKNEGAAGPAWQAAGLV